MTKGDANGTEDVWRRRARVAFRRLEFGDLLLFLYIAAFARECLWGITDQRLAWTLTVAATLAGWCCYVAARERTEERTPRQFWLVVALPLLVVYAMRVSFPDVSFDVLNYRLAHSERALRGFLFLPGDFFPSPAPYNPAPDIVTGISRHLLGYRLGTIVNYLALVWTGTILCRMLRPYVHGVWLRCAAVLLILFTEHILFEINNYMVDLLTLPLLLEATRLALQSFEGARDSGGRDSGEPERSARDRGHEVMLLAFLLGASVAFKLTNLAFAAPILLVYAYGLPVSKRRVGVSSLLVAAILFVAPLLPFCIYIWRQTGSPVFPLYNAVFKSPYWPLTNVLDPRWGGHGFRETLLWPLLLCWRTARLCEIAVYSGRIPLGFVAALVCLSAARFDRRLRALSFITLLGSLLWSAGSGYIRYALFLELTGGVVLVRLSCLLWTKHARRPGLLKRLAASLPLLLLAAQCSLAVLYVSRYEWSMRPTMFAERRAFADESEHLLRDHSLADFLTPRQRDELSGVEVWAETSFKTNGVEALLKPDAPIVAVRMEEFFGTEESRRRFARTMGASGGKRLYTLCFEEDFPGAQKSIQRRGLGVGKIFPLVLPYYSTRTRLHMLLIEVTPAGTDAGGDNARAASKNVELPDTAFRAQISVRQPPAVLHAGRKETVYVTLKNVSGIIWPGKQDAWKYQLTIGNRWLRAHDGSLVTNLDARAALLRELPPGDEIELPLTVNAPAAPGEYILEIDAVQEGVTWFGDKGSETLKLKLRVVS